MYVIRYLKTDQYFCYKHTQIIGFKNPDEANSFAHLFFQYSMTRAMQEDPRLVFEVMSMLNLLLIEEQPEDIEIIDFDILKKDRQR